jgi:hypothetical protein
MAASRRRVSLPVFRGLAVGGLLLMLLPCGGCRSATGEPLPHELAGSDPDSQIAFWHALPTRKAVTNDEGLHALLLFIDSQDAAADYAGRVQTLKARRMLPHSFQGSADDAVKRGTVAVVLVRALSIHGGLTLMVLGPEPRYAVRELVYAGVYPPSSPQQDFSGPEFLGIIGRAEDYQRRPHGASPVMTAADAGQGLLNPLPATQPISPTAH